MSIFTWLLRVTDMSEEQKEAAKSWHANPGASNEDIVKGTYKRGFISKRQMKEALRYAEENPPREAGPIKERRKPGDYPGGW